MSRTGGCVPGAGVRGVGVGVGVRGGAVPR